jgi:hypothetical protein
LKQITNWRNATVSDIETDALFAYTKVHVLSYKLVGEPIASLKGSVKKNLRAFLNHHLNNGIPIIFHNGICFDIPALEYLLDMDLSKLMVIDTLDLSWYLNHKRDVHGLDSFFEDYGVEKLKVDETEWAFVSDDPVETKAHYERMKLRCTSDVEINSHLWVDLMERLEIMYGYTKKCIDDGEVDGTRVSDDEVCYIDRYKGTSTVDDYIDRILTFLMMKADNRRLKEKTRWKVDVPKLDELIDVLGGHIDEAKVELGTVMPKVPKYVKRNEPAELYKKNRELNAHALKWNEYLDTIDVLDELGNPLGYVDDYGQCWRFVNYEEPNVNSPDQIKKWLFANGWKPRTFKWVKDKKQQQAWVDSGFKRELKPKPRGIPQINMDTDEGKELCPSVVKLAETIPEILAYSKYTLIKHRFDMVKGFKDNMSEDGHLKAEVGGTTNTLRVKHRKVANLPAVDKPYGVDIRGLFICVDGNIQEGSDLSGLEDRTKHHFMIPHDPEYVKTMMDEGYDAHVKMALVADLITELEFDNFMYDKTNKGNVNFKPLTPDEDRDRINAKRSLGKTCLPVHNTEVLTRQGWKYFKDIGIGDEVLGGDLKSKTTKFTKVTNKVFYKDRETLSMGTVSWKLQSTPDHRWPVQTSGGKAHTKDIYRETANLKVDDRIYSSLPYLGGSLDITVSDARVLGWILSEGYLRISDFTGKTSQTGGKKRHHLCSVSQDERKFKSVLEKDLKDVGFTINKRLNSNSETVWVYFIKSKEMREWWARMGMPLKNKRDIDFIPFILTLNKACLEGLFDAFWLGDGPTSESHLKSSTKKIYQNKGNICDAIHLVAELLGKSTLVNTKPTKNSNSHSTLNCRSTGWIGMQKTKIEKDINCDVFCLSTELGNFVIRQNEMITITGNCNYASVYNAGAETIARDSGMSKKQATELLTAYWELNWSVKVIAAEQVVFETDWGNWLINPINGFCYSLRKDSDRFSTLCQGTGSFFFDMWVDNILEEMYSRWGVKRLSADFHDEFIMNFKDTPKFRKIMSDITLKAIDKVNETYILRRKLGADIQFGLTYADIH